MRLPAAITRAVCLALTLFFAVYYLSATAAPPHDRIEKTPSPATPRPANPSEPTDALPTPISLNEAAAPRKSKDQSERESKQPEDIAATATPAPTLTPTLGPQWPAWCDNVSLGGRWLRQECVVQLIDESNGEHYYCIGRESPPLRFWPSDMPAPYIPICAQAGADVAWAKPWGRPAPTTVPPTRTSTPLPPTRTPTPLPATATTTPVAATATLTATATATLPVSTPSGASPTPTATATATLTRTAPPGPPAETDTPTPMPTGVTPTVVLPGEDTPTPTPTFTPTVPISTPSGASPTPTATGVTPTVVLPGEATATVMPTASLTAPPGGPGAETPTPTATVQPGAPSPTATSQPGVPSPTTPPGGGPSATPTATSVAPGGPTVTPSPTTVTGGGGTTPAPTTAAPRETTPTAVPPAGQSTGPAPTGDICIANLTVVVFHDVNGNGRVDTGEDRLPGWSVEVQGPRGGVLTTGPQGTAWIGELQNDMVYSLKLLLPPGSNWYNTTPNPRAWTAVCGEAVFGVNQLMLPTTGARLTTNTGSPRVSVGPRLAAGRAATVTAPTMRSSAASASGRGAVTAAAVRGWLRVGRLHVPLKSTWVEASELLVPDYAGGVSRSPRGGVRVNWHASQFRLGQLPAPGDEIAYAFDGQTALYFVERVRVVPAGSEGEALEGVAPDHLLLVTCTGPDWSSRILIEAALAVP